MKKSLVSILTVLLVFIVGFGSSSYAAPAVQTHPIFIDGQRLISNDGAVVEKGISLVPFEEVLKKMGFKVSVNNKEKTFSAVKDEISINGTIGSKYIKLSGKKIDLGSTSKLINGKLYVPVKIIGEINQGKYSYDPRSQIIYIGEYQPHDQYFHMNWGMTKEQIKKLEGKANYEGENVAAKMYQVTYNKKLGDYKLPGSVSYFFNNGKLAEAYIDYDDTDFTNAYSAYVNSYNHLNKVYGEFENDMKWSISNAEQAAYWDFYDKDIKGMFYMALLTNDLSFDASYENEDTKVRLILSNIGTFNDPIFSTFIYYEPK